MKRVSVTIIALFALFAADAQITKSSLLLGGNLGFQINTQKNISNGNEYDQRSFSFSPVVGKTVKENLVVGLQLSYTHAKNEIASQTDVQTVNGYGGGVFVRKYKQIKSSDFYVFGEAGLDANFSSTKLETALPANKTESRYTSVNFGLTPGIAFAMSKRFHVETGLSNIVSIGYAHTSSRSGDPLVETSVSNSFGASTSLSNFAGFNLGFRFFLSK